MVTPVNDGAFDEWLQSESPDRIFDRFMTEEQFSQVRERCPDVRILDTIDLHFCVRRERQPDTPDLGPE